MKEAVKTRLVIGVTAACLLAAGLLQPRVSAMRKALNPSFPAIENAPPLIAFTTVAMAGLRGVLIDVLWARITVLQDSEDYIEIVQLADWITKLEPRLAVVWDYHSFNMAYNIARMCPDPESRWRWVNNGIRLLRDQALVYNPDYLVLYDRLCRIYEHKMILPGDPARQHYRLAWAREMAAALGNADVANRAPAESAASRLRSEYKLDVAVMQELDSTYGPFDWRLPEAHVVYWAHAGRMRARENRDLGFDFLICQAASQSAFDAQITAFDPARNVLETAPDAARIRKAIGIFDSTLARHGIGPSDDAPFAAMYLQFLRQALILAHGEGRPQDALDFFSMIKDKLHDPESSRPLEEYLSVIQNAAARP